VRMMDNIVVVGIENCSGAGLAELSIC